MAPTDDDNDVNGRNIGDKRGRVDSFQGVETNEEPRYPSRAPTSELAPEKPQRAYAAILAVPGNDNCADCGASQPRWASMNLGITLCIECAGIHRSLGVQMSKVRSLTLDTEVWSPEIVQLMVSLGNSSVNDAYLACYRGQVAAIEPNCGREERENWIRNKYLLRRFMSNEPLAANGDNEKSKPRLPGN